MHELIARESSVRVLTAPELAAGGGPGKLERRTDGSRSLSLFWQAILRIDGLSRPALVVQISPGGLRVRYPEPPVPGTHIRVDLPGIPPLRGEVRWHNHDRFGVQLAEAIDVIGVMRRHRAATGTHLGFDPKG